MVRICPTFTTELLVNLLVMSKASWTTQVPAGLRLRITTKSLLQLPVHPYLASRLPRSYLQPELSVEV